jgi:2-keto-4-pentenoate hydratase
MALADEACLARAVHAADLLLAARGQRRPMMPPDDFETLSPDDGYVVQDMVVAGLLAAPGGRPVGWKIGCTNASAQRLLGLDGPFFGRLLSPFVHQSPATLPAGDFNMRCIEAEFAFRLGEDLPAGGAPYDRERVAGAVAAVLPAIEIVDTRFRDWQRVGAGWLIADNASAGHWVRGAEVADWRRFELADHRVDLRLGAAPIRRGSGAAVLGHPLAALTWLANALAARGRGLLAGELVTTGTSIDVYFANAGDALEADFGALGRVSLRFAT